MRKLRFLACFLFTGLVANAQNNYDVPQYFKSLQSAKTLYAQQQWKNAAVEWEKVLAINPYQGNGWNDLGKSYYNIKEYKKAISAFGKACDLKYYLTNEALYNIACCYSLLNQKDSALHYLERSSAQSPNYRIFAQGDSDFNAIKDDEKFKSIVGIYDVSKLSREDGWKFDLNLFSAQYKNVHVDPFKQMSEKQFDELLAQIVSKINQLTDMQLTLELMKLLRIAADGHTGIYPNVKASIPLQFFIFEDGVFITSADKEYAVLVGSQVVKVGNTNIQDVLAAINPTVSLDNGNQQAAKVVSAEVMRMPAVLKALNLIASEASVSLTVKDLQGATKTVEIKSVESNVMILNTLPNPEGWVNVQDQLGKKAPLYLRNTHKPYWFEYSKEEKMVYFQFNSVRNDPSNPLNNFLSELNQFIDKNDVEKLVLDIRMNNGGNTYLLPPLLQTLLQHPKINQKNKLFCITGRRTFSAAQNLTTLVERFTNATLVGEPSSSSPNFIGESVPFKLPYSQLMVNFSNLYWQTSIPADKRSAIVPEILIQPTFADYIAGKDRCMESIQQIK